MSPLSVLCYFATFPRGGSSRGAEIAANDRSFHFHTLKLSIQVIRIYKTEKLKC